jgi:hypothetical protein
LNHSSQVVPNFGALRSIHHVQGFFLPNLKGQMILVFLSWYHCRLCQPAHPRPKGDQENIFTKLFVSCDLSKIFFLILQTSTFVFFSFSIGFLELLSTQHIWVRVNQHLHLG